MLVAITREVSASIASCELTHVSRVAIDVPLAREQHRRYQEALARLGCDVVSLPALDELPDAVFVEDVALVLDEVAIVLRPGAVSRRPEARAIADVLRSYRTVVHIEEPGTVDGGDVLRLGKTIYVGLSGRSNAAAIDQLRGIAGPFGYSVSAVPVSGCLHLKSAVTEVAPGVLLVNPAWVDPASFGDVDIVAIDPAEPYAANALCVVRSPGPIVRSPGPSLRLRSGQAGPGNHRAIYPSSFSRTRVLLESRGIALEIVNVSELQKAEGAVTCCSLIFR